MKGGLPSPSSPQLRTVQVGAPSTGPASCLAGPKRKPPRGVPTEPEGVRSSSPRVSGQCKGHQVSIIRARDSRNSLVGGSAVQGTWVLYLRGSFTLETSHTVHRWARPGVVTCSTHGIMWLRQDGWGAPVPATCPRLWGWHLPHSRENVSTG